MDELNQLFISYSKDHKMITDENIEKIISLLADEYGLNDYIDSYKVVDFVGDGFERLTKITKYDDEKKQLLISSEALKKTIRNEVFYYNYGLPANDDKYLIANAVIIQSILHEIQKINQQKIINNSSEENIETDILKYAVANSNNKNGINPAERIAEIKAWEKMRELVKNMTNYPRIIKYCDMKLSDAYTTGYYDNNNQYIEEGPTYNFCYEVEKPKTEQVPFIRSLEQMQKKFIGTEVKILYGLPVSQTRFNRFRGHRV